MRRSKITEADKFNWEEADYIKSLEQQLRIADKEIKKLSKYKEDEIQEIVTNRVNEQTSDLRTSFKNRLSKLERQKEQAKRAIKEIEEILKEVDKLINDINEQQSSVFDIILKGGAKTNLSEEKIKIEEVYRQKKQAEDAIRKAIEEKLDEIDKRISAEVARDQAESEKEQAIKEKKEAETARQNAEEEKKQAIKEKEKAEEEINKVSSDNLIAIENEFRAEAARQNAEEEKEQANKEKNIFKGIAALETTGLGISGLYKTKQYLYPQKTKSQLLKIITYALILILVVISVLWVKNILKVKLKKKRGGKRRRNRRRKYIN